MLRVYGLGLIFSTTLDGRKDIQSVKSGWSVCVQSLNPAFYPLWKGIIRGVKQTRNTNSDNPIFMHIHWKIKDNILKLKRSATRLVSSEAGKAGKRQFQKKNLENLEKYMVFDSERLEKLIFLGINKINACC